MNSFKSISKLLLVACISVFVAACASSNSGSVYKRDDARKVQTVKTGVVESVRTVKLEGTKSPIGAVAGGAIGGIAGAGMSGGGRAIAEGAKATPEQAKKREQGRAFSVTPMRSRRIGWTRSTSTMWVAGARLRTFSPRRRWR